MNKNDLIVKFDVVSNKYSIIHSAGPDIYFNHPVVGYIIKGYAKFLYKGKTFYAYPGDVIYISTGTRYQSIWYGYPDIEWYSVVFEYGSKYTYYDYRFQIIKNYKTDVFEKMYNCYENNPMISVSLFYAFLDDIYSFLKCSVNTKSNQIIQSAIEYIENNYNEQITISQLASLCNMSESGFFKLFKKTTGVTPVAYKHNIMIQHAVDLVSNTSKSIEEISSFVGFASSNYFRKCFYEITDKNPSELRKRNNE